jgi:hypothetical protein
MKMSGRWFDALRFVIGVLLVWGVATTLWGVVRSATRSDSSGWRLAGGEFCTVEDFMAPKLWSPTEGFVYDREYQLNPGPLKPKDHLSIVLVDWKTLVMVDYDSEPESIRKGEPGRRDVDERVVSVFYISGPLSGRRGIIARYKLAPRDTR